MWIVVFDKLLLGSDDSALKNLIGSKRLQDFIDVIYELEAPENIYICLNEKIYDLNMLKYEAADCT